VSAYLSIVSGAIKLFNYLAAALQQHHDEINGVNRERADENAAAAKVNEDVAQAAVTATPSDALKRLRRGDA
jgi:molybdate-binding protein